jgi:hypothetical protein
MTGRQLGAVAAIFFGGVGCMKADRLVAVQIDTVPTDALQPEIDGGGDAAWGRGPFSAPTPIVGLVSETTDVHGASLTKDELEIYFACQLKGDPTFHIWSATRPTLDSAWPAAVLVTKLFGSRFDVDPEISPDGLTIYFSSDRLGAGFRLYVSQRSARDQQWTNPQEVVELTSSTMDRYGPSVDPTGLFMVFGSATQGDNDYRLYSASRSRTDSSGVWGNVQELSGINSGREDDDPALFHDSLSLIWSSRAYSNGKSWDLVEVSRPDLSALFSAAPVFLTTLNTSYSDRYPWVSQDGTHIVFSIEPESSPGALYEAWR